MFKIIEELKRGDPKRREKLLFRMREKNIAYFRRVNPELAEFVQNHGTGFFEIRITEKGIDLIDTRTQQYQNPPGELFKYMADFGSWHHTAWVDKISMKHIYPIGEHGRLGIKFYDLLLKDFPEFNARVSTGVVALPQLPNGRRYSGAVIFLGIFSGLHIINYLNRTKVRDVYLIEPDQDRFALSCWFLDYEHLEKKFGRLMLHVGADSPESPLDEMVGRAPVTSAVWVRLLAAYQSDAFEEILNRVSLRWRALTEIFVPFDREQQNLVNGAENIRNKLPFYNEPPKLSSDSTIAVVGSGPSLSKDMAWLKQNQDRLIIVCPISAARVLQENGIRIDFQCTLDTELDEALWEPLRLDPKIPLVAYYKINPELARRFEQVYLVSDLAKANAVRFKKALTQTHPTTGNLTMAFAVACAPAKLFILGMDFGFHDAAQSHVKGSYLDDGVEGYNHQTEVGRAEHIPVEANFEESNGKVLSLSYYNAARHSVEAALAGLPPTCQIINLSDGAKIKGASPARSGDVALAEYDTRHADLGAILSVFTTDHEQVFECYETPGRELLTHLKDTLIEAVTVKQATFDMVEWAKRLDAAWAITVSVSLNGHPEDMRIEIWGKLVLDMLGAWYRVMLYAQDQAEAEMIYRQGLSALGEIFSTDLTWPDKLDQVE